MTSAGGNRAGKDHCQDCKVPWTEALVKYGSYKFVWIQSSWFAIKDVHSCIDPSSYSRSHEFLERSFVKISEFKDGVVLCLLWLALLQVWVTDFKNADKFSSP